MVLSLGTAFSLSKEGVDTRHKSARTAQVFWSLVLNMLFFFKIKLFPSDSVLDTNEAH